MSFDNSVASKVPSYVASAALFVAITLFGLAFMAFWPASLLTGDTLILLVVVVGSLAILYVGLAVCRATMADTDSTILRLSLLIWFVLLFAEGLFDRAGR